MLLVLGAMCVGATVTCFGCRRAQSTLVRGLNEQYQRLLVAAQLISSSASATCQLDNCFDIRYSCPKVRNNVARFPLPVPFQNRPLQGNSTHTSTFGESSESELDEFEAEEEQRPVI